LISINRVFDKRIIYGTIIITNFFGSGSGLVAGLDFKSSRDVVILRLVCSIRTRSRQIRNERDFDLTGFRVMSSDKSAWSSWVESLIIILPDTPFAIIQNNSERVFLSNFLYPLYF